MGLGGILTAMVTPFDQSGKMARGAAGRLMAHLLDHGSDGLVLAGSTGEGSTLSDHEKIALFEQGVEVCHERGAIVVANTGSNDTAHSVELSERAAEAGVDALLVVTPYYVKPNRAGLLAHFRAVAQATDVPVVAYNIPSRCVVDMPNDLLRELAEIPGVEAVKQARFEDVEPIEGLDLLAGNDEMLAHVLDVGGTGGICVASNLVGEDMRRMIDEPQERAAIHASLEGIFAAMSVTTNPIPVKAAMNMLGHEVGGLRLPLVEASDEEKAQIRAALDRHGILSPV